MPPTTQLLIQLVYPDGHVCRFPGGGNPPRVESVEASLIDICVSSVAKRNLGLFKTQAQVETAVREALIEALQHFKNLSIFVQ